MLVGGAITSGAGGMLTEMKVQACDTIAEGTSLTYSEKIC
jgi:hypothetical protein